MLQSTAASIEEICVWCTENRKGKKFCENFGELMTIRGAKPIMTQTIMCNIFNFNFEELFTQ